jgi:putative ABC transport system substrate-binding protein
MRFRRQKFITGLKSAAASPVVAPPPQRPVIGYLGVQSCDCDNDYENRTVPFLQGLRETGYVEGENVAVEYRRAENQFDRLAADLVRRRLAVIAATGAAAALAAKAATMIIPVVFAIGSDPVPLGLVASLNRPGTNVTGIASQGVELAPKQLQLLRELIPNAARVGVLVDPASPATLSIIADLQVRARSLGMQLVIADARTYSDLESALETFSQQYVDALLVGARNLDRQRMKQLVALAARRALPTIFPYREHALAGGLMSFSSSIGNSYRLAGIYTGRILKGEKPADLPVVQPTKFELVINLKIAKALGLTIPETLLATADQVIQ